MKWILLGLIVFVLASFGIEVQASSDVIVSTTIDAKDSTRETDYLVYFSYNSSKRTPANQWGFEIAVDSNNMVIETSTNVTMEEGGFALSGHGVKRDMLMNVRVGDIVEVDLTSMTVVIRRDEVLSAYFLSQRSSEQANAFLAVASEAPLFFDVERVTQLVSDINLSMAQVEALMQKEELSTTDLANLRMYATQIGRLSDQVFYQTRKSQKLETRALWHRPNAASLKETSLAELIRFMDRVADLGFNTIYVETFWNGYVSYRSEILETHPNIASFSYGAEYGNDYIKAFIGEANKRGIDVHAWTHTFNAGNATNIASAIQNEWLVENYQGQTLHPNVYGGSYYLDPSNEDVLEFVETMFLEMMDNYNFAGIQLDYIRYYDNNFNQTPIRDSGYGALPEARFKEEMQVSGDVRTAVLTTSGREKWDQWRMQNITNAVARFSDVLRSAHPDVIISADVVGNIASARATYMQDWLTWVRRGYIDLLCPMIYTGSSDMVFDLSQTIFNSMGNLSFLTSGIAPIYYGHSTMANFNQVLAGGVFGGQAIFASQNVIGLQDVEDSLRYGAFREEAVSLFTRPNIAMPIMLTYLREHIHTFTEDDLGKNIFLEKLDAITNISFSNAKEFEDGIQELELLSLLTYYLQDETLRDVLQTEIERIQHYLDVWVSRDLIRLGYYDPATQTRPKASDFTYPVVEEPTDPTDPTEPTDPLDPTEPEDSVKKGCLKSQVAIFSSLVLGGMYFLRKKEGV